MTNDFPGASDSKASAYNAGDPGLIPGWGRSSGEGNGNPLQYSCLEYPMGEACWATVHGVAKSRTGLSDFTPLHLLMTNDVEHTFMYLLAILYLLGGEFSIQSLAQIFIGLSF